MTDWTWVALGYATAFVAIGGYVGTLVRRWARVRRQLRELR